MLNYDIIVYYDIIEQTMISWYYDIIGFNMISWYDIIPDIYYDIIL